MPFFVDRQLEPRRVPKRTSWWHVSHREESELSSTASGDAWEIRAARNQSLFRAINEELRVARRSPDPEGLTIACECADTACVETLEIDMHRYAEIRREPTHFVVRPGHVYPEVEKVVDEEPHFTVVEKIGEAATIAIASNGTHGGA